MLLEHYDIGNFRWTTQLQGHLCASKVYMQEVQWNDGHNQV